MKIDGASPTDFYNTKTNLTDVKSGGSDAEPANSSAFRTDDHSTGCPTPIAIDRRVQHVKSGRFIDWRTFIDCKRKGCSHCGPILYDRHVEHFTHEFKRLPRLRFITLTIDRKIGVTRYDSRDFIVDTWTKFYHKLYDRCRSWDASMKYVAVVEYDSDGYAHMHLVASLPLDEETIEGLWFEAGGGVVSKVQDITSTLMLKDRVSYCMKNAFNMPWNDGPDDETRRSIFNSQDIGYYSERAKERRRKAAQKHRPLRHTDPVKAKLCEMGEYQDALIDALQSAAGEDVVLPDGRVGVLLSWSPHQAHVLVGSTEKIFGPLEVEPADFEPPLRLVETITPWSAKEREPAMSEEERLAQKQRFERLRKKARTTTYVRVYDDGRKMRFTYDQKTGRVAREVISRSTGPLDM